VHTSRLSSSRPAQGGGFSPGTVLVERYRIVALLGRGGMGEVYRAEDLKLGNVVALKFLPASLQHNDAALAGFHAEVRNARQVSHPNVCRVYDIGEVNGQHFLTMEYIDGEDLASLLRRIGRLPADKALETAHQICAGLAAAHDCGLLHRDLKPANIMLDGRGRVRITDFGLALSSADATGRSETAGTPAYMAPEQIGKGEASIRSDIYSLGLVFYELFTGRMPYHANTPVEWQRAHLESSPRVPSSVVKDIDPVVETAILRCLQKDPAQRPSSVRQVAAAFPGGDPLAAALAAGETPSPEMVAAAGDKGAFAPRTAWIFLAGTLAVLALVVALAPKASDLGLAPLPRTPDALTDRARELVEQFGYNEQPADTDSSFLRTYDFLRYRALHEPSPQRVRELAPAEFGPMIFWYRQSPSPLVPAAPGGNVSENDPPMDLSGMVTMELSSSGKLIKFHALPPQVEDPKPPSSDGGWAALFAAAGLDLKRFTPSGPKLLPPVPFDARTEWDGSRAEDPATPLHVTAAAYRGKPVYFDVLGPWNLPGTEQQSTQVLPTATIVAGATATVMIVGLLVAGAILARRNVRMGRGDRKGSFQVSAFVFSISLLGWILGGHHVWEVPGEFGMFLTAFCIAVGMAAFFWVSYMALEPYVRRRWPDVLISWTRLLSGKVWDPLVGRDVLAGALVGSIVALSGYALDALPYWFNVPGLTTVQAAPASLGGPNRFLALGLGLLSSGLLLAFITLSLLFLARLFLRKQWLAIAITGLLVTILVLGSIGENFWVALPFAAVIAGLLLTVLIRFGFLALCVSLWYFSLLADLPVTVDFSRWYMGRSLIFLLVMIGLAVYGFRAALAGRPVFGNLVLEE
jgi:serine/threonine-protein kinase